MNIGACVSTVCPRHFPCAVEDSVYREVAVVGFVPNGANSVVNGCDLFMVVVMDVAWRVVHVRSVLGFVNRVLMLVGFLRADAKVNCVPAVARAVVSSFFVLFCSLNR